MERTPSFTCWGVVSKDGTNLIYGLGSSARNAWENAILVLYEIREPLPLVEMMNVLKRDGYRAKRLIVTVE